MKLRAPLRVPRQEGWTPVPFTPEEIESKEFLITLRGYDKDEVNAFLRAVATDYRDMLVGGRGISEAPSTGGTFEALGQEVSSVLQVARETASQMKSKAQDEAASLRRRAEEESGSLREAATKAARRLTEEAERHAIEVRAQAEREASERLRESVRRVEKLQATETKVRQRLFSLETMLQTMRQELEAAETAGIENEDGNSLGTVDTGSSDAAMGAGATAESTGSYESTGPEASGDDAELVQESHDHGAADHQHGNEGAPGKDDDDQSQGDGDGRDEGHEATLY